MFTVSQDNRFLVKKLKKNLLKFSIGLIILATIIIDILVFTKYQEDLKLSEKLQILFASLISISFGLVFYQLKEQMDWNRRELSVSTLANYITSNRTL